MTATDVRSFQVSVVRHALAYPKWWQLVSQLYLKNELSYEVKLLHVGMDAP